MRTQESLSTQTALYGEPLGTRFARVLRAYGISQSRLASVIGISAPMLSQLASGQRVKINNPAVYGRLLRLEQLAKAPEVAAGDPVAVRRALDDVASSTPRLALDPRDLRMDDVGDALAARLAGLADAQELEAAAGAVPETPLALVLAAAARVRRSQA